MEQVKGKIYNKKEDDLARQISSLSTTQLIQEYLYKKNIPPSSKNSSFRKQRSKELGLQANLWYKPRLYTSNRLYSASILIAAPSILFGDSKLG